MENWEPSFECVSGGVGSEWGVCVGWSGFWVRSVCQVEWVLSEECVSGGVGSEWGVCVGWNGFWVRNECQVEWVLSEECVSGGVGSEWGVCVRWSGFWVTERLCLLSGTPLHYMHTVWSRVECVRWISHMCITWLITCTSSGNLTTPYLVLYISSPPSRHTLLLSIPITASNNKYVSVFMGLAKLPTALTSIQQP